MARTEKTSGSADTINDLVLRRTTIETATLPAVANGGVLVQIELDKIEPNPDQPRQWIDPEKIAELAASIVSRGTRQPDNPILVRPAADGQRFVLVSGERRWRAKQLLREQAPAAEKAVWNTIRALLHDDVDDEASAFIALEENLQREDLSPVEEGAAYVRLMERYSAKSIKELAARIGKPEKRVQQMIRLHRAPLFLRDAVVKGKLIADGDTAEGGKQKQTRRRLEFRTAVEFLKLFDHLTGQDLHARENSKAREKIEERVEAWVERALAEGWSVRRVEDQCAAIKNGRQRKEPSIAKADELPAFEVTADRFIVYPARANALEEEARRDLVARVARALEIDFGPVPGKDHVGAGAF